MGQEIKAQKAVLDNRMQKNSTWLGQIGKYRVIAGSEGTM